MTEHQKHDAGPFEKLVSMQIVDIQRRPIIYSTCVQRLSVYTYTRVYTLQLSPPPAGGGGPAGPRPEASLPPLRVGYS